MTTAESQLEEGFIAKLRDLKYEHREDIRDRAALESNFRQKFQALNHVQRTDAEFQRLLDEIVTRLHDFARQFLPKCTLRHDHLRADAGVGPLLPLERNRRVIDI